MPQCHNYSKFLGRNQLDQPRHTALKCTQAQKNLSFVWVQVLQRCWWSFNTLGIWRCHSVLVNGYQCFGGVCCICLHSLKKLDVMYLWEYTALVLTGCLLSYFIFTLLFSCMFYPWPCPLHSSTPLPSLLCQLSRKTLLTIYESSWHHISEDVNIWVFNACSHTCNNYTKDNNNS
jgi:hypothetical protein